MGVAQAAIGLGATLASKFLALKSWTLINEEGPSPVGLQGQFPPEDAQRSYQNNYAEISALNRQNPILQFINGELETLSIQSQFWRKSGIDTAPTDKIDELLQWAKVDPKLRRPPILQFVLGDGLGLSANVVLLGITGIKYGMPNAFGGIRQVTFQMDMKFHVPFDIDAEEVTDTRYARAKYAQEYEQLAFEEYADPMLGVVIRQRHPLKPIPSEGDTIALPAIEGVRNTVPEAMSVVLKSAFGSKDTDQRALRIAHFERRSGPKISYIHNQPRSPVAVNPSPSVVSATTNESGDELSVVFSTPLDAGSVPLAGHFLLNGTSAAPDGVLAISNKTLTIPLDASVVFGESLTLDYASASPPLQSSAQTPAAPFVGQAVQNQKLPGEAIEDGPGLILSVDPAFVTLDVAERVETIHDQSTDGNDLETPSPASRFLPLANYRNGKPGLDSSGANRYARRAVFTGGDIAQSTIIGVFDWSAHGSDRIIWDGSTSGERNMLGHSITSGDRAEAFQGSVLDAGTAPPPGTPCIAAVTYSPGALTARIEPHGEAVISWSGNAGSDDMGGVSLGCRYSSTLFFQTIIGRFAIYDVVKSPAEIEDLLARLRFDFNIYHS